MKDNFIDETVRQSMTEAERLEHEEIEMDLDLEFEYIDNEREPDDDRHLDDFMEDFLSGGLPDEDLE